jgi:hypothetical protein
MYKKLLSSFFILCLTPLMAFEKVDGGRVAADANKVIGKPYVWGGNDLNKGVDCSALVKLIYSKYGYSIPRTAATQVKNTQNCPTISILNQTKIGDSLYFKNAKGKIHHVAIISGYDSDGRPIITHAKGKNYGVIKERMSHRYVKEFIGAKRFYNCTSPLANTVTEEEVSEAIILIAEKYKIDPSTIYTIASIESNFKPYVITIETTPKIAKLLEALRELGLKIITGGTTFHSKQAIVNIYPKDIAMAQYIAEILKQNDYDFDLGLMQIHSTNFTLEETAALFYPKNNIEKSMKILRTCMKRFKAKKNQIECYNRGGGNLNRALLNKKLKYPYYSRFIEHYNKYF